jgi:hypothetical protein
LRKQLAIRVTNQADERADEKPLQQLMMRGKVDLTKEFGGSFWGEGIGNDTFRGSKTSDSICGKADIRFRKEIIRSGPTTAFNSSALSFGRNSLSTGTSAPFTFKTWKELMLRRHLKSCYLALCSQI